MFSFDRPYNSWRMWTSTGYNWLLRFADTITQGSYIELAHIPPVEGPLITPPTGAPVTLYEYGYDRYCSINQGAKYGVCQETIVRPRQAGASPTEPPTEVVATRLYTGSLMPVATIYTSLPSWSTVQLQNMFVLWWIQNSGKFGLYQTSFVLERCLAVPPLLKMLLNLHIMSHLEQNIRCHTIF